MDMIAFGRKVKNFRESHNMRQEELADRVGLKKATISRYENGTIKKMDTEMVGRFARAMQIDVDELLQLPKRITTRQIPLIGTIAAGVPLYAEQNIQSHLGFPSEWNVDYALRVKGDSMWEAGIPDGSIVVCMQSSTAESNDIAVCLIDEEEATLKRVKYYDGLMVLHAENSTISDKVFKGREQNRVKILGIARLVLRNL
ncbi:MAG: LexA family protein [Saccharofermentanales bacterium]